MNERMFALEAHVSFSEEKAVVNEVVITENSSIAVWGVKPGQEVKAHFHLNGQDTWIMLRGQLTYYLGNGEKRILNAGECALAQSHQVHGAVNEGTEDAVFVSIYSAPEIGYSQASP